MEDREVARSLAMGRIAIGTSALLTTKLFAVLFAGREAADDTLARIAGRLFGIREIAIALATLDAIDQGRPAKRLLQLGILCDVSDALAILAGSGALPWRGRFLGVGLAAGFAATGVKASSTIA